MGDVALSIGYLKNLLGVLEQLFALETNVKDNVLVNVQTDMSPHTKVWLDTTLFRQLIMHILRTAAQNTEKGHINIRYATEKDGLRFWIENTCDPISQEVLATLFSENADIEGKKANEKEIAFTMSICKAIIDNMKGTIEATSRQENSDNLNVITFWFPCTLNIE